MQNINTDKLIISDSRFKSAKEIVPGNSINKIIEIYNDCCHIRI